MSEHFTTTPRGSPSAEVLANKVNSPSSSDCASPVNYLAAKVKRGEKTPAEHSAAEVYDLVVRWQGSTSGLRYSESRNDIIVGCCACRTRSLADDSRLLLPPPSLPQPLSRVLYAARRPCSTPVHLPSTAEFTLFTCTRSRPACASAQ